MNTNTTLKDKHEKLLGLLQKLSFERKHVILASGKESDFYIDCKQTALTAQGHELIGELVYHKFPTLGIHAFAGVELGGCPLASAASHYSSLIGNPIPAIYIRKQAKDHGTKKLIEGNKNLPPDSNIILLEDVITTGLSSIRALQTLLDNNYKPTGLITLVDRLEGGQENIREFSKNLPPSFRMTSLFTRKDFIPD